MGLAFTSPIHLNGGLIFAAQDYVSAPAAFAGAGVASTLRYRGRFAGVGIDNNGFMSNDSDPSGDPLSYRIVSSVSHGTLETYLGGAFTYTPNAGFVGVDSFVYQLFAGGTAGSSATVLITVDGAFSGASITGQLRLRARPAALSSSVALQAVPSRVRMSGRSAAAQFGYAPISLLGRLRLNGAPAALTISANNNQVVNGDFSGASIAPWILGPNTLATIVNGQVRLSAVAASQTPIYIYQTVSTVPGATYTLDADVIPGLGFGSAGIAVADTLIGSGGFLSYGGHITAPYTATANQTFIALNYAIIDTSEYVLFDNVAFVGANGPVAANLQAFQSFLRLRSDPATSGQFYVPAPITFLDHDTTSELDVDYRGGAAVNIGLSGIAMRIRCEADLSDTTTASVLIKKPDGTTVSHGAVVGTMRIRSTLGKILKPYHYVTYVVQANDFAVAGRHYLRVVATSGTGATLPLRRILIDVSP